MGGLCAGRRAYRPLTPSDPRHVKFERLRSDALASQDRRIIECQQRIDELTVRREEIAKRARDRVGTETASDEILAIGQLIAADRAAIREAIDGKLKIQMWGKTWEQANAIATRANHEKLLLDSFRAAGLDRAVASIPDHADLTDAHTDVTDSLAEARSVFAEAEKPLDARTKISLLKGFVPIDPALLAQAEQEDRDEKAVSSIIGFPAVPHRPPHEILAKAADVVELPISKNTGSGKPARSLA